MSVFFIMSERPGLNLRVFSWWIICAGAELAVCGEGMRGSSLVYILANIAEIATNTT